MGWLESLPAHRHWCWVTTSIGRAPIAQATGDGGLRSGIAVRNADWPWRDLSRMVATSRAKYFRLRVLVPAPTPAKGSQKRPAPESWRPKVRFSCHDLSRSSFEPVDPAPQRNRPPPLLFRRVSGGGCRNWEMPALRRTTTEAAERNDLRPGINRAPRQSGSASHTTPIGERDG